MGVYLYPSGTETELKNAYIGYRWLPGANTVGYRPLNISTEGTDQSGNSYDFTVSGSASTFTTRNSVECYSLGNPARSLISTAPNIPSGSANRTISIRVNTTSRSSSQAIFSYGLNSGNGRRVYLYASSANKYIASIYGTTIDGGSVQDGVWVLLTFVVSSGDCYFYVNGELKGSGTGVNTQPISSSYKLSLGRINNATDATTQFYGFLSELIIEKEARTAQQISNYYNSHKSYYGIS